MGNILDFLKNIKNARYGKDVRDSIHDAIQQCYYDGKAGTIDLKARQELEEKATKQEVAVERARIDNFVSLEQGSTTGDAELADLKVGDDGVTYPSAGTAVRQRMSVRNVKAEKLTDLPEIQLPVDEVKQAIEETGAKVLESIPDDYTALAEEVANIRTGADGKVYNSADEAVRGQVIELKSDLGKLGNDFFEVAKIEVGNNKLNPNNLRQLGYRLDFTDGETQIEDSYYMTSEKIPFISDGNLFLRYIGEEDISSKIMVIYCYSDTEYLGYKNMRITASNLSIPSLYQGTTNIHIHCNININSSDFCISETYLDSFEAYEEKILIKESALPQYENNKKKTIVCFGDSITEFTDDKGKSYTNYLSEMSGYNIINCGIGGSQLRQRETPTTTPTDLLVAWGGLDIYSMVKSACTNDFAIAEICAEYIKNSTGDNNTTIVQKLKNVDWSKVDGAIILGGTNDWSNGKTLGTPNDTTESTTLGALNEIIRLLLTTYPHIKLYIFTPIVRWIAKSLEERTDITWCDMATNGSQESKRIVDYVDGIIEVSENNKIPVCDMFRTLGWNKYNFAQYFNDNDGTHPYKGFEMLARKIYSFMESNRTF